MNWLRTIGDLLWHMPGRSAAAALRAAPASFWAQTGAAMAMTGVFIGYGLAVWLGAWPEDRAEQRLTILGWGLLSAAFLVLVALVCIMGLKLAAGLSRDGVTLNAERDDDPKPEAKP